MVALHAALLEAEVFHGAAPLETRAGAQVLPEQEERLSLPTDALSCSRTMPEPVRVEVPLWTSWPPNYFTALPDLSPAKVVSSGPSAKVMHAEAQGAEDAALYVSAPLSEAGHLFPPGLSPVPGTPSRGSAEHALGSCRPCAWVWKAGGCQSGHLCSYCHLCPEGELKSRKKSKLVFLRLGLETPKASPGGSTKAADLLLAAPSFCFGDVSRGEGSEAETTTASGSDRGLQSPSPTDATGSPPGCFLPLAPMAPTVPQLWPAPSHPLRVGTPSEGSALHESGVCRPCAWYWKPTGCQKETKCRFCHMCPDGEVKNRKKKKVATLRIDSVTPTSAAHAETEGRFPLNLANCL